MPDTRAQLVARLSELGAIEERPVLGAWGLYLEGRHFAILSGDRLFFRTRPETLVKYKQWGSVSFQPNPKLEFAEFYEVPEEIRSDAATLVEWARSAAG